MARILAWFERHAAAGARSQATGPDPKWRYASVTLTYG